MDINIFILISSYPLGNNKNRTNASKNSSATTTTSNSNNINSSSTNITNFALNASMGNLNNIGLGLSSTGNINNNSKLSKTDIGGPMPVSEEKKKELNKKWMSMMGPELAAASNAMQKHQQHLSTVSLLR